MKRGVKFITFLTYTLLNLCLIRNFSFAQNSTINISYTAPIGIQTLNPNKSSNKNYYNTNYNGAAHSIISEIFKNTNTKLNYIPYTNYNEALQASMLSLSNPSIDLIIGITFDENNLDYLNYIPIPIYNDNIAIVINSSNVEDKNILTKDLFETISKLSRKNKPISIENLNMNLPSINTLPIKDINTAMETILNTKTFLITPLELVIDYLTENKTNPRVKNLKILKYSNSIPYLIAINKNKTHEKITLNGEIFTLKDLIETRLNEIIKTNQLQQIINEFKIK